MQVVITERMVAIISNFWLEPPLAFRMNWRFDKRTLFLAFLSCVTCKITCWGMESLQSVRSQLLFKRGIKSAFVLFARCRGAQRCSCIWALGSLQKTWQQRHIQNVQVSGYSRKTAGFGSVPWLLRNHTCHYAISCWLVHILKSIGASTTYSPSFRLSRTREWTESIIRQFTCDKRRTTHSV